MKSFTDYITEEWITSSTWLGEVFKNPSPRELTEYLSMVNAYGVVGILYKKDVYLFDGMHDDMVYYMNNELKLRDYGSFIRFRAINKGNKLVELGPSGGNPLDYMMMKESTRKKLFEDMAKVYTNKYLKPRMGALKDAFREIKRAFASADELNHYDQLVQQYRLK